MYQPVWSFYNLSQIMSLDCSTLPMASHLNHSNITSRTPRPTHFDHLWPNLPLAHATPATMASRLFPEHTFHLRAFALGFFSAWKILLPVIHTVHFLTFRFLSEPVFTTLFKIATSLNLSSLKFLHHTNTT